MCSHTYSDSHSQPCNLTCAYSQGFLLLLIKKIQTHWSCSFSPILFFCLIMFSSTSPRSYEQQSLMILSIWGAGLFLLSGGKLHRKTFWSRYVDFFGQLLIFLCIYIVQEIAHRSYFYGPNLLENLNLNNLCSHSVEECETYSLK